MLRLAIQGQTDRTLPLGFSTANSMTRIWEQAGPIAEQLSRCGSPWRFDILVVYQSAHGLRVGVQEDNLFKQGT